METSRQPGSFQDLTERMLEAALPEESPARIVERASEITAEVRRELGTTSPRGRRRSGATMVATGSPHIFYPLQNGVLVTETWFCADRYRYAVSGLHNLRWSRGSSTASSRRFLSIVLAIDAISILVVPLALTVGWLPIGSLSAVLLPGGLALALLTISLGANYVTHRRTHRLWADYHGTPHLIYTTTDAAEFRKVCRAALLAVDSHRRRAW